MTGCFDVKFKLKGKDTKARSVELPEEILADLGKWWELAESGDKFEIYCELGM